MHNATELTAANFLQALDKFRTPDGQARNRALKSSPTDEIIGVRMGDIFALAKQYTHMPIAEIELLLASPVHEVRVGAVSIMDYQARVKHLPDAQRKALFDLYLRRHDRIDSWDLVDRSAIYVVGGYLADRPRDILDQLARSDHPMERRTAILATAYFLRQGDLDDTIKLADVLMVDENELVNKAVGWMLREVGKQDLPRLLALLDAHAAAMPRTTLRYAIEHLDQAQRTHYMNMKQQVG